MRWVLVRLFLAGTFTTLLADKQLGPLCRTLISRIPSLHENPVWKTDRECVDGCCSYGCNSPFNFSSDQALRILRLAYKSLNISTDFSMQEWRLLLIIVGSGDLAPRTLDGSSWTGLQLLRCLPVYFDFVSGATPARKLFLPAWRAYSAKEVLNSNTFWKQALSPWLDPTYFSYWKYVDSVLTTKPRNWCVVGKELDVRFKLIIRSVFVK